MVPIVELVLIQTAFMRPVLGTCGGCRTFRWLIEACMPRELCLRVYDATPTSHAIEFGPKWVIWVCQTIHWHFHI